MVVPFIQRKDMKIEENTDLYTPKLKQCLHNLYKQMFLSLNMSDVQRTHYSSNLFIQTSFKVKYTIFQNINKWIISISLI